MQISLNLNLIINEVSDSQITSPRQKLADTSVRRAPLASAGPHAKPLPPACLAVAAALGEGWKEGCRSPDSWSPNLCRFVQRRLEPFTRHTERVRRLSQAPMQGT